MRKIILSLLVCSLALLAKSQESNDIQPYEFMKSSATLSSYDANPEPKKSSFDVSKLEFGGNLGLQFGDYTIVNVSPQVGYKITPYSSLGITLGYTYCSYKSDDYSTFKYSALTFGTYARLYPIYPLVLSIRPEVSQVWRSNKNDGYKTSDSGIAPTFLIGGGIRLQGMIFTIEYDIVQNKYSPYGDGLIYTAGLYF